MSVIKESRAEQQTMAMEKESVVQHTWLRACSIASAAFVWQPTSCHCMVLIIQPCTFKIYPRKSIMQEKPISVLLWFPESNKSGMAYMWEIVDQLIWIRRMDLFHRSQSHIWMVEVVMAKSQGNSCFQKP